MREEDGRRGKLEEQVERVCAGSGRRPAEDSSQGRVAPGGEQGPMEHNEIERMGGLDEDTERWDAQGEIDQHIEKGDA